MGLFGKKKIDRDEIIAQGIADAEAEAVSAGQEKKDETFNSGNPKMDMEITKIKAQLESYNEIRKANSERFSRVSEQMGEMRGMIMDTNKTMSKIEVSATKAIDLVESVQPEKLMIEIRKQEGKGEALKANIESNEAMMKDLMEELKKMRRQMNFYKGIEQVAKLNEEVKGEIFEIKKVEATIERHADKAETIFLDMEKKFAEFDKFQRTVDEMEKTFHAIQTDFDKMKLKLSNKAERKEFGSLMDKFTEFEKHTGNILKLLDERSRHMKMDLRDALKKIKEQVRRKHGIVIDEKSVKVDRLPAEESKYLEKASETTAKPPAQTTPPTQPPLAAPPSAQPAQPAAQEEIGLRDVLRKRGIISHKLSDEEDEAPAEASQAPQTNQQEQKEEMSAEDKETSKWE